MQFGSITSEVLDNIVAVQKALEAARDVPVNVLPEWWSDTLDATQLATIVAKMNVQQLLALPQPIVLLLHRVSVLCEIAPDWNCTCAQIEKNMNLLGYANDGCCN